RPQEVNPPSGGTGVVYTGLRLARIAKRAAGRFGYSAHRSTAQGPGAGFRAGPGAGLRAGLGAALGAVNSRCSRMGGVMIPYMRRRTVSSSDSALGLSALRLARQPASSAKHTPTKPFRLSSPG